MTQLFADSPTTSRRVRQQTQPGEPVFAPSIVGQRLATLGVRWDSLATHAALLAMLLTLVFLLVDKSGIIISDEGVVLRQADVLNETGVWASPPESPVDPDGAWYALEGAASSDDGLIAYPRLFYPITVAPLLSLGGIAAVLAAHVAVLWMTAVLAARIAERVRPGSGPVTLWMVGAGSPLLFDGYFVVAHLFGALAAVVALWGAVVWLQTKDVRALPAIPLGIFVAGGYRTEGVLFGLALCLAMVFVGRGQRVAGAVAGVLSAVAALAVYEYLGRWRADVLGIGGSDRFSPAYGGTDSWLAGRVRGTRQALIDPGLGTVGLVTLIATVALVGAAVLVLRGGPSRWISAAVGVSVAAGLVRLLFGGNFVPGLLIAAPGLVIGGICLTREHFRDPVLRVLLASGVLSAGAVLATQYNRGAGTEWGGRYIHVGLVPLLIVASISLFDRWNDRRQGVAAIDGWRMVMAGTLVLSGCLVVSVVQVHHRYRGSSIAFVDAAREAASGLDSSTHPDGPVVVSTWAHFGRFAWEDIDRSRMFTMDGPDDLSELGDRLLDDGVTDMVLVLRGGETDHVDELLDDWSISSDPADTFEGRIVTLTRND